LQMFDPISQVWKSLSHVSGNPPKPRSGHGFTAAGVQLYVHGGTDVTGENRELG